jgi:hypothetical protein
MDIGFRMIGYRSSSTPWPPTSPHALKLGFGATAHLSLYMNVVWQSKRFGMRVFHRVDCTKMRDNETDF